MNLSMDYSWWQSDYSDISQSLEEWLHNMVVYTFANKEKLPSSIVVGPDPKSHRGWVRKGIQIK